MENVVTISSSGFKMSLIQSMAFILADYFSGVNVSIRHAIWMFDVTTRILSTQ